jgi:hypothetical protein
MTDKAFGIEGHFLGEPPHESCSYLHRWHPCRWYATEEERDRELGCCRLWAGCRNTGDADSSGQMTRQQVAVRMADGCAGHRLDFSALPRYFEDECMPQPEGVHRI